MSALRMLRDRRGTAAAELAMVAPILLLIMFGSVELGRYFYNQHILVKAVRDGAVFAARQPIDNFNCPSSIDPGVVSTTETLVKTGGLSNNADLLPQWDDTGASFTMSLQCFTATGGTTLAGIYTANGGNVPVITLEASLPYSPITGGFGGSWTGASLHATQQTPVVGL